MARVVPSGMRHAFHPGGSVPEEIMRRVRWAGLMVVLALAGTAGAAAAQSNLVPVRRHVLGVSAAFMHPTGEFQEFVSWGGGADLSFVAGLGREGPLGLRVAGSVLWYGHEHYDVWVGPRLPDSYYRVNTNNFIANVGVGPQLTLGAGPVRPYGFALAGVSYFATTSSVDNDWGETWDSETNFDDARFALGAGGGVLLQLGGRSRPLFLDVGAHWIHNGRTTYLREGSIIEFADGSTLIVPIRSDANHWTFRLGVAVGI
jgi:hypothetical protein